MDARHGILEQVFRGLHIVIQMPEFLDQRTALFHFCSAVFAGIQMRLHGFHFKIIELDIDKIVQMFHKLITIHISFLPSALLDVSFGEKFRIFFQNAAQVCACS